MKAAGFQEIEHTADWSLRVWAPDLAGLLEQAARGMYSLLGIELAEDELVSRKLALEADSPETLLVDFLGELLYYAERERFAFRHFFFDLDGLRLKAVLEGSPILAQSKEIKAVTYHQLEIVGKDNGLQAEIVFDV